MKMRFLRDKFGVIDRNYMIAVDGSYIRDKETRKKLIPYISNGYRVISINFNRNCYNVIKISRLQWMAWKGVILKGYHIHHKKFSKNKEINAKLKLNDHKDNLDCMTNSKHMSIHKVGENNHWYGLDQSGENAPFYGHHHTGEWRKNHSEVMTGKNNPMYGSDKFGEKNYNAKLINDQVKEIRKLSYLNHVDQQEIADEFKVSKSCINNIVQGYRWNPDKLTKEELINSFSNKEISA